jgi:hypothetical protein
MATLASERDVCYDQKSIGGDNYEPDGDEYDGHSISNKVRLGLFASAVLALLIVLVVMVI